MSGLVLPNGGQQAQRIHLDLPGGGAFDAILPIPDTSNRTEIQLDTIAKTLINMYAELVTFRTERMMIMAQQQPQQPIGGDVPEQAIKNNPRYIPNRPIPVNRAERRARTKKAVTK